MNAVVDLLVVTVKTLPPLNATFPLLINFSRRKLLIVSYLYHCCPRKMGSRYYIGKRDIGVCRRYCRDTHVFGDGGNSLFFAYPSGGG